MIIKLGDKVIDSVTEFTGTVISITTRLNGSTSASVQPLMTDYGRYPDSIWFEIDGLNLVNRNKNMKSV